MFGQGSYQIFFSTHILTRRMTPHFFLIIFLCIFQLTSSQGGWQFSLCVRILIRFFNSHPHKEDDFPSPPSKDTIAFSTHILTRRMTHLAFVLVFSSGFSTHILTRRMTCTGIYCCYSFIFQLTSSQGGWPFHFSTWSFWKVFQLTSSQGGWPDALRVRTGAGTFQLTSSQGGWL